MSRGTEIVIENINTVADEPDAGALSFWPQVIASGEGVHPSRDTKAHT
jgi:hypothetical protein